jgi:hypothetical protein
VWRCQTAGDFRVFVGLAMLVVLVKHSGR